MYVRRSNRRGFGQTCADATSPVGTACDDGSTPVCPAGTILVAINGAYQCLTAAQFGAAAGGVATPVPALLSAGQNCAAGANGSGACSWFDNIWASDGCLAWYAACDPTNPFYVANTKGLIAGGSQILGTTAANSLTNFLTAPNSSGIPTWVLVAGVAGLGLFIFLKK